MNERAIEPGDENDLVDLGAASVATRGIPADDFEVLHGMDYREKPD